MLKTLRSIVKGPKTLEEWIAVYEERCGGEGRFVLAPDEKVVWDKDNGFFTWCLDAERKMIVIPKMAGNGRHWRKKIFEMMDTIRGTGVNRILTCSRRNPKVYQRVHGGKLYKMEHKHNFVTGESSTLWWYIVTWDDYVDPFKGSEGGETVVQTY